MGLIAELGHTGIMVRDLDVCRDFYTRVIGLTVTDEDREKGLIFLSSRPEVEHHELVLSQGRGADEPSTIQQISWRVPTVAALQEYDRRFRSAGVRIDRVITHGNAIAIYFFDPESNRNEVYFATGIDVRQPFARPFSLEGTEAELMARLQQIIGEAVG
jgi:catechol-2,3-dioxygenase